MTEQQGTSWQSSGSYTEPLSRQRRGLLVFLLDQSGSMGEEAILQGNKLTLAQVAASVINSLLAVVVNNAKVDPLTGRRKNNCDIGVFGYGDKVKPLLNETLLSIPDLADKPIGHHHVRGRVYDQLKGQEVEHSEEQPYWLEPKSDSNWTEMAMAISTAQQIVHRWLTEDTRRKMSFPPIVINITDGRHNSTRGGDPVKEAEKLKQLRTNDGAVLLFNCHITKAVDSQKLKFPYGEGQIQSMNLSQGDTLGATQLFRMSSIVPQTMVIRAQQVFGRTVRSDSRGFLYNATGEDLVNFLSWGTRQGA